MTVNHVVDPEVGTRNWTKFVKLGTNGKPESISESPNFFKTANGNRPVDQWLAEEGFRGYVDAVAPSYNKYTQKVVKTPLADLQINNTTQTYAQTWSIVNLTTQEKAAMVDVVKEDINKLRDNKIRFGCIMSLSGLVATVQVSGSEENMRNITNLAILANYYISTVTPAIIPFRDEKNVIHTLTPQQMLELWQKAMTYVSSLYQASWVLKDSNPVPLDFEDQKYWPSEVI